MEPVIAFAGLLLLIAVLARKARTIGRDAGLPALVITVALGVAVR